MERWLLMGLCDLPIPLLMLGISALFATHPPRTINRWYDYRTAMSMKNQDTWDFAHRCCARVWRRIGLRLLAASLVVGLLTLRLGTDGVALAGVMVTMGQTVVLLLAILPVEQALRRTFDGNGARREVS